MRRADCEDVITVLEGISFNCIKKYIRLSHIKNIQYGIRYAHRITTVTPCFVKKLENGYYLLNIDDQRLQQVLTHYNGESLLSCHLVSEQVAKQVEFYTNDLLPQLTALRTFNDFFYTVTNSTEQQEWIAATQCGPTKTRSTLKFNLSEFTKMLGKNAPSTSKISRLMKKNIQTPIDNTSCSSSTVVPEHDAEYMAIHGRADKQDKESQQNLTRLSLRDAYNNQDNKALEEYEKCWAQYEINQFSLMTTISTLRKISEEYLDTFFVRFEHKKDDKEALIKLITSINQYLFKINNGQ